MPWQLLRLAPGRPGVMAGISAEEAEHLGRLAAGRRVLEIGSAYGASTIAMGLVAREVVAVDPHQDAEHGGVPMSREWLGLNLTAYGLEQRVRRIERSSREALSSLAAAGERFDLAFIDGDHRTAAVTADALNARALAPLLVFHDYGNPEEAEVQGVVDALFAGCRREQGPGWLLAVWVGGDPSA